jgi:dihydrofolate reductase
MKVTYYVASSLDGFIAREDGDVSWLDDLGISGDSGYADFFGSVDGLIMGRKTYEAIASFSGWPYGDKPTWVCSSQDLEPMAGANLQPPLPVPQVIQTAQQMGLQHLWVIGGGALAGSLINQSLLTILSVAQMPIILGNGIPLFSGITAFPKLRLKSCQTYTDGFCQLTYHIESAESIEWDSSL